MADYPGAIPAIPDIDEDDMSSAVSQTADRLIHWGETRAVTIELGLTPSGPFSTVKARLDDMTTDVADHETRLDTAEGTIDELVASEQGYSLTPGGNSDATTSGTLTDWITIDTISVPAWATSAVIEFNVTGAHSIDNGGGGDSTYLLSGRIGGTTGAGTAIIAWLDDGDRRAVSWTTVVTGMTTGAQTLKVAAQRVGGNGQARVDAVSRMSAKVTFR